MSWFYFSIFSIFALAVAELTQQHLLNLKDGFSENASVVLTFAFQFILAFPMLFLFGLEDQIFSVFKTPIWQQTLVCTFIAAIAMVFYLKSFKVKNISLSAVLISSSVLVSTFLGIMFLAESVTITKFVGIFLILSAIGVVNLKNSALEKNHLFGLLAGVMFGIAFTFDKSILQYIHPLVYIFWSFLLIATWVLLFDYREIIGSLRNKKVGSYMPIVLSGLGFLLYNFLIFSAYRAGGEVGKVDAINTAYIFLIIFFEYFFLKHTKGVARKLFSGVLAVLGIFLLGVL